MFLSFSQQGPENIKIEISEAGDAKMCHSPTLGQSSLFWLPRWESGFALPNFLGPLRLAPDAGIGSWSRNWLLKPELAPGSFRNPEPIVNHRSSCLCHFKVCFFLRQWVTTPTFCPTSERSNTTFGIIPTDCRSETSQTTSSGGLKIQKLGHV